MKDNAASVDAQTNKENMKHLYSTIFLLDTLLALCFNKVYLVDLGAGAGFLNIFFQSDTFLMRYMALVHERNF